MRTADAIRSYRDLIVWQRAMELAAESYRIARLLPPEETEALADQIRRAAVSVPANIAEGHGRAHRKEFIHHLSIARGSLLELMTHFEIVTRVGYAGPDELQEALKDADEVRRMLTVLIRRLIDTDQ